MSRQKALAAARQVLAADPGATMEKVAKAARMSRATLYRHFHSRGELLAALDLEPDPAARDRVLAAASDLIGRDGLNGLSIDELAAVADVSRASVYRLFPGKAALFAALVAAYSPFEQVARHLETIGDQPPEKALTQLAYLIVRETSGKIGVLRTLLFEVTTGSPDAVEGYLRAIQRAFTLLRSYLEAQMAAGRIRRMQPLLAAQALIGPLLLFLLSASFVERLTGSGMRAEVAANELAIASLGGLLVSPAGEGRGGARGHQDETAKRG